MTARTYCTSYGIRGCIELFIIETYQKVIWRSIIIYILKHGNILAGQRCVHEVVPRRARVFPWVLGAYDVQPGGSFLVIGDFFGRDARSSAHVPRTHTNSRWAPSSCLRVDYLHTPTPNRAANVVWLPRRVTPAETTMRPLRARRLRC